MGIAIFHDSHTQSITMSEKQANEAASALSPGFQEDFFGCFGDIKGCLLSFICCCIVASSNRANLDGRPVEWIDYCCAATPYQTRQSLRQKYALDYSKPVDCIASYICMPCYINQNTREIAARAGKEPTFMG